METAERIVRHLRLRADSEAAVRRAVLKLEDALRCASLPDTDRRVLLVRRLNLGRIDAGLSSQSLSLQLEQHVAAVGGAWVHGVDPSAARADFVLFRDTLEARYELALRLAQAVPCGAWYWPLAVPEFKPADGAQANIRRIAFALAALPEAPAALPTWIARLCAAGVASALVQTIGSVEGALLLRAARLSADTPHLRATREAPPQPPRLASVDRNIDRADISPQWEIAPAFAALPSWMQVLARAGGFVPPLVSAAPIFFANSPVGAPAGTKAAAPDRTDIGRNLKMPIDIDSHVETALAVAGSERGANASHELAASKSITSEVARSPDAPRSMRTEAAPELFEPVPNSHLFPDAASSVYAGLLFLLPVLQNLSYAAWAESLPEGAATQVVQRLLALVLLRMHAPPDDPAWLFANFLAKEDFGNLDAEPPAVWRDATLAAPRGCAANDLFILAKQTQSVAAFTQLWLAACRRWLRRAANLGVASLVLRPASLRLTATHADVFFQLRDADMRVRRAGLDFNPGWLPWYGRVVTFHYSDDSIRRH
jgi:hypothetical protein